ncbi:MAG: phosphatidate cytidylyltransferase [Bdellovibrionales bacterium]
MSPAFQRFNSTNLRLRMISAAIMAPVALLAVYLGGIAFGAVLTCALTIGLYEWLRLTAPATPTKTTAIACAFLIVLMTVGLLFSPVYGAVLAVLFTVIIFLISLRDKNENAGWTAFGIPYMGGSGLALLALRATPEDGMGLIFFLLAVVWSTDIGAFLVGCLVGGPKLAPAISPSKTWAGLIGGMGSAMIFGYAAAAFFGAEHPALALILSPVLACVAQAGDLFESHFKRRSGVKESGDIIPGHGGVLDRIDGLVFAGIFAYLFQATLGMQFNWW